MHNMNLHSRLNSHKLHDDTLDTSGVDETTRKRTHNGIDDRKAYCIRHKVASCI